MTELRVCHHNIVLTKVFQPYLAPTCVGSQLVAVIMEIFLETAMTERALTLQTNIKHKKTALGAVHILR